MTDEERIAAADKKYQHHAHRLQAGVGLLQAKEPQRATAKELRTGIDSLFASDYAISRLLIAKGIFTEAEYHEAQADAMELEANTYEKRVQDAYGNAGITLGSAY